MKSPRSSSLHVKIRGARFGACLGEALRGIGSSGEEMGQAFSYKDVLSPTPTDVLSDPQSPCHFVCMRNAPSSKNYNVYKDSIDGLLWLFVRKKGHTLHKNESTSMILENFRKEVLCVARLEPKNESHFNPTYSFKNLVKKKVDGPTRIGETKLETINTIARDQVEWKCQTKAVVYRSHSLTEIMAEVCVEATGSVQRETEKIKGRDSENFPSIHNVFVETRQVDSLQYIIRLHGGHDIFFSLEDPNSPTPIWDCPLFSASVIPSDDWRWKWHIQVKEGYDPSLSLLIGLVCSSILTPEKIKSYFRVDWL